MQALTTTATEKAKPLQRMRGYLKQLTAFLERKKQFYPA
jgi:hypothetical protein